MRHRPSPRALRAAAATALAVVLVFALAACSAPAQMSTTTTAPKTVEFILASTTSTQDSGLFSVLIPAFEKDNPGYKVKVIAVGSGEAIKLGEKKDADVLLVHSPAAEKSFVASGYADARYDVMYNDFVIVGPKSDPAKIGSDTSAVGAFTKIANAKTPFASRGDASGTYTKEVSIWTSATIDPKGQPWYLSTGQGMGETLKLASEKQAYTLADRATWLSMAKNLDMTILVQGDKKLLNQYGVLVVKGAKNEAAGKVFEDWILSAKGQAVAGAFGVDKYGQQLFIPNAKK
ncbi:MAG TPA: extracellular solute-binding protein [Thermoleophilia bacterium]